MPDLSRLTPRERDIVAVVLDGATNLTIVKKLGLQEQTVKNCLSSIFDKLGVANRLELAPRGASGASSQP